MTTAEAMQKIEVPRFSAITNLASDFKTFLRILEDQPEMKTLAEVSKLEDVPRRVFDRVLELADSPVEGEYEHPADAALAAYLWLLSNKDSHLSASATEKVLGCKQCRWSRKMAEYVRNVLPRELPVSANSNGGVAESSSSVPPRQHVDP